MTTSGTARAISLDDKYTTMRGRIFINGVQALVRLPMLQKELDRAAGLNTAGYLSGYRGSPLGGLDAALWGEQERLAAHDIVFRPGVNEDLAMTAIWGTQLLRAVPDPTFDGVFAYWYGKGPGVDRSGDPMKHGNYNGTNRNGGVLLVYGDDHPGKSSTIAHQSEQALAANSVPSLYPANVAEFIEFGLKGWAMSRYAGLWVGFKTVNETVEQTATVDIDLENFGIEWPERDEPPPGAVNIESGELVFPAIRHEIAVQRVRMPLLHRFVRANGIDRVTLRSRSPRLGIVTAGKAWMDVVQALSLLGIDQMRADALGVSVYKAGLIWPLEPEGLKAFAKDHQELFFVEEKKAFMEPQAASILFNESARPRIVGKTDEQGVKLLESDVQLEPLQLALVIADRLQTLGAGDEALAARASLLRPAASCGQEMPPAIRSPYFCSGCPHNTSTKVPEGSVALAGIGCHTMAVFTRADTLPPSQMGGEGAQWAGLAPFTETSHVFQNLGDGTYFHSGLACIRNSVAAGNNITYKILYNDAVAMTGGQPVDGPLSVGQISRQVRAEGVADVVLVTDDPGRYRASPDLPEGLEIRHRDDLTAVQERLRETPGCTVIIYEQTCAAEKRRRRKRGQFPDPAKRMFINEEVCEGCGDCSEKATCVSILPQETAKGTKRRIDQSACNKDYSCNNGFCPSFVTVYGGSLRKPQAMEIDESLFDSLPEPAQAAIDGQYGVMVAGIGGTGVITVSAVLGMAAHIDGRACSIFDMTGLAQKNGAVYSHLKIADDPAALGAQKLGIGDSDLMLAFDLVAGVADEAFRTLGPERSRVLGNSATQPTVAFQFNPQARVDERLLIERIHRVVGEEGADFVDATGIALALTGNTIAANLFLVGYALQHGLLPLSLASLKQAIELNGVAVAFNLKALQLGRLYAADRGALREHLGGVAQRAVAAPPASLDEALARGRAWLGAYQDPAYAERFADFVSEIARAERRAVPGSERLAVAVANNLAKLMAYKDEYEVARLHASPEFRQRLAEQFEGDYRIRFNLAPPLLARRDPATGLPRKREFGGWMLPVFGLLAKLRGLRGTAFDIFGYSDERRMERRLIEEYTGLMREVADSLSVDKHELALRLAETPQLIKGYGHVKARNVETAQAQQASLLAEFRNPLAAQDTTVTETSRAAGG